MVNLIKHFILIILVVIIGFNVAVYGGILFYRSFYPHKTVFMQTRLNQAPNGTRLNYSPIGYDKISIRLKKALIASEDANFAEHSGFDWNGIQAAIKKNNRTGKIKAGGSTISQQLAKNLFLTPDRNFLRKGEEAVITAMLEFNVDKERIFDLYINVIEWGEGIFGVEAAANHYYKKSANQLSTSEAARLASMVNRPVFNQKNPANRRLKTKTNTILRRMRAAKLPDEN